MRASLAARLRDDAGTATLETCIAAVLFIMVLVAVGIAGQNGLAQQTVAAAASAAAREASFASTTADATTAATTMAHYSLDGSSLTCASVNVDVDTTGLDTALGTTGTVTVTVDCAVYNANATLIGLPGTSVLSSTTTVPVDAYRERN